MNKSYVTDFTGISSLRLDETKKAARPANISGTRVLVQIHAVSLNYRDYEVISGLYSHHKGIGTPSDIVPCSDFGGEVTATGPSVSRVAKGDRVMSIFNTGHIAGDITEEILSKTGLGLPLPGVLQEYRVFDESSLVKIPKGLSYAEGSTLPIAAGTAWTALFGDYKPLRPGQTVLILGTGGVSIFALQIASLSRAKTIVTSSSDQKLKLVKLLGATHTINYKTTPDWDEEVMRLTDGRGVDQIIECGGQNTLTKSFNSVKFGGLINAIGYLGGKGMSEEQLGVAVLALRRHVTYKVGQLFELRNLYQNCAWVSAPSPIAFQLFHSTYALPSVLSVHAMHITTIR